MDIFAGPVDCVRKPVYERVEFRTHVLKNVTSYSDFGKDDNGFKFNQ